VSCSQCAYEDEKARYGTNRVQPAVSRIGMLLEIESEKLVVTSEVLVVHGIASLKL
jgi:hypothetical protein